MRVADAPAGREERRGRESQIGCGGGIGNEGAGHRGQDSGTPCGGGTGAGERVYAKCAKVLPECCVVRMEVYGLQERNECLRRVRVTERIVCVCER